MVETHRKGRWEGSEYFHEADYVLATDYAALEAERDSLSRRINPDGAPVDVASLCLEIDTVTDELDEWKRRCENIVTALGAKGFSAEFLARIAEGRDNG